MTLDTLYSELSSITASREDRLKYANFVLNDLTIVPKLLDIVFMVNDKTSCRAAWVLEFVCDGNIYVIVPYLDGFTANLKKLHLDSSIRPISKVCFFIAQKYCSNKPDSFKKALNTKHKEHIIESCFDWMIGNQKIAAKAYAMDTLYLLGSDFPWVRPQLVQILERDFNSQSAGYKVRAKRILKKLKSITI